MDFEDEAVDAEDVLADVLADYVLGPQPRDFGSWILLICFAWAGIVMVFCAIFGEAELWLRMSILAFTCWMGYMIYLKETGKKNFMLAKREAVFKQLRGVCVKKENQGEARKLLQYLQQAKAASPRSAGVSVDDTHGVDDLLKVSGSSISLIPRPAPARSISGLRGRHREGRAPQHQEERRAPTPTTAERPQSSGLSNEETDVLMAAVVLLNMMDLKIPKERVQDHHPKALIQAIRCSDEARALRILRQSHPPGLNQVYLSGSVLHHAAGHDLFDAVEAILARPDFTKVNAAAMVTGHTVLHSAASRGQLRVCRAILRRLDFVELHLRNRAGRTAKEEAQLSGQRDIADFLQTAEVALRSRGGGDD